MNEFLTREVQYSQQLYGVLKGIQHVNQLLGQVETASKERRILDSLRLLESMHSYIQFELRLRFNRIVGCNGRVGREQDMSSYAVVRPAVF